MKETREKNEIDEKQDKTKRWLVRKDNPLPGTPGVVGVMNIHIGLKEPKPRLYNCNACDR